MTRKRLSRADSRELTSQRLLDAAHRLFARKGFDATSIDDIAEAAGYSRGAFYSNFKTKKDLLFDLLRRDQERINARFSSELSDEASLDEIEAQLRGLYVALSADLDVFLTWTEARLLSARDARFRAKLSGLMAERRDFTRRLLDYLHRRAGTAPGEAIDAHAMGLISLIEGVRLVATSSPAEMPPELAQTILSSFMDVVMKEITQGPALAQGSSSPTGQTRADAR